MKLLNRVKISILGFRIFDAVAEFRFEGAGGK
jgi:hypothetical protein